MHRRKGRKVAQSADLRPDARERALDALALSRREGLSLTRAARAVHSDPRTVQRYAGAGWERRGRRYVPRSFDRIEREVALLGAGGATFVRVRDSRQASLLAEHANAVRVYVERGDTRGLRRLKGRSVTIRGQRHDLVVDPVVLDRLAAGAELHYELYQR